MPDVSILRGSVVNSSYIYVPQGTLAAGPLTMEVRGTHVDLWRRNSLSLMLLDSGSSEASEDVRFDPKMRIAVHLSNNLKGRAPMTNETAKITSTLSNYSDVPTRMSLGNWRPKAFSKKQALVPDENRVTHLAR